MDKIEFPKLKWRVGWRPLDAAKSQPAYHQQSYETWNEAAHIAREMSRDYPTHHFFIDSVPKESNEKS